MFFKKIKRFCIVLRSSFSIAGDPRSFFVLVFLFFYFKFFKESKGIKVKIKHKNKKFYFYVTDRSDLGILEEIFIMEEYRLKGINPKIILDLGANVGLSAIYFSLNYPDSTIYAFEPNKKTFLKLKRNTKSFNNIKVFNWAVADFDGQTKFYENERSMSSSIIKRSEKQEAVVVDCFSLETILRKLGLREVDLLKFDVEGFEFNIFKNFREWEKIKFVIGEIHLDLMEENLEDFKKLFLSHDIDLNKNSDRRYVLRANLKN